MNRFKKEIRKRGIKLECDYPYIPYNGLETVIVHSDKAIISEYHVCAGWVKTIVNRDFTTETIMEV